jgi:hypothetical protein
MTKPKEGHQDGYLTLLQKAELIEFAEDNPSKTHENLAQWATKHFKLHKELHRATVSRTIKRKAELRGVFHAIG